MTLIDRLKAAKEGSRELDAHIHIAAVNPMIMTDPGGYNDERPVVRKPASVAFANWQDTWTSAADLMNAPHYTTSVDAALQIIL